MDSDQITVVAGAGILSFFAGWSTRFFRAGAQYGLLQERVMALTASIEGLRKDVAALQADLKRDLRYEIERLREDLDVVRKTADEAHDRLNKITPR